MTVADKEINQFVIDSVKKEFADHGVLGEEISWQPGREKLWVCDPIDGTRMYNHHIPVSMFSLALVIEGEPVVAVTYNPWVEDLYWAVTLEGCYRNGQKITTAKNYDVTVGVWRADYQRGLIEFIENKNWRPVLLYPLVIKGCLIAEGSLSGQIVYVKNSHDIAAIKLLIEEAGGKVTDLDGNDQRYDRPINGAVMSNGLIHDELLELVRKAK